MQHESLVGFAFEQIHALVVIGGSERGRDQRLRFAAGEHGRTVSARQKARFDPDRTDLVELALVGTFALVKNLIAEDLFLQLVEQTA